MGGALALVLAWTLFQFPKQAPAPCTVAVPDGTPVDVRVQDELSSQHLRDGDVVTFEVAEPVKVGNAVIISQGAAATARIVGTRSAGHFGRQGRLGWMMDAVTAVDGTKVPLRFIKEMPVGGAGAKDLSKKQIAAGVAVASPLILYYSPLILAAIPFVAAQKGKPEIIPAGERYLVFVSGEVRIQIQDAKPVEP